MNTKKECEIKTTVRLMCDNTNLYIGYDCQGKVESAVTKKQLDGVKSSKEPWLWGDHIEIFIGDGKSRIKKSIYTYLARPHLY